MKKFVGYVNGKTFNDEKSFNDAAKEAIKSNDGNLAISSYYSESYNNEDEPKKELPKEEKDPNYVPKDEYLFTDQTPAHSLCCDYTIDLKNKIRQASNKEEISKVVNDNLYDLKKKIATSTQESESLEKEIENLQNELYDKDKDLCDFKRARNHYLLIKEALGEEDEKEEEKTDCPDCPNRTPRKSLKNLFDYDDTLFGLLHKLNILK